MNASHASHERAATPSPTEHPTIVHNAGPKDDDATTTSAVVLSVGEPNVD